jgi:short-subunit dehydrogenase
MFTLTFRGMKVLITGASSGIGQELARLFAGDGAEMVLLARRGKKLALLSEHLNLMYKANVAFMQADLSRPGAPEEIYSVLKEKGFAPDVLVNNAGFGIHGPFDNMDLGRVRDLMQVNMQSLVELTRLFLPAMLEKRRGAVLNVASTAAFQPLPMNNIYAASKAFVVSFSEAIREELKESGISVTCLCPGPTETEFFEAGGYPERAWSRKRFRMPVEAVARVGFKALKDGKATVIPGFLNNLVAFLVRFVPRRMITSAAKRAMSGS